MTLNDLKAAIEAHLAEHPESGDQEATLVDATSSVNMKKFEIGTPYKLYIVKTKWGGDLALR